MKLKKPLMCIIALCVFSILVTSAQAKEYFVPVDMSKVKAVKVVFIQPKVKVKASDYYAPVVLKAVVSKDYYVTTIKPVNKKVKAK